MSNISKSGATYPTSGNSGFSGRTLEDFTFYDNNTSSSTASGDWVSIGSDTKTLRIGSKNGNKGDYIRVIPVSAILGAILLLWADIAARTIMAPEDIPIGIVTGLVGGAFFIWLLGKK